MTKRLPHLALILLSIGLVACTVPETAPASGVSQVFPGEPKPDVFNRAFGMTESPDGTLRLYARERDDSTGLYLQQKRDDGSWSAPRKLAFEEDLRMLPPVEDREPRRDYKTTVTMPAFDPITGNLLFSTNAPLPGEEGLSDQNIWLAEWDGETFVNHRPLPDTINTGALESSPAMDEEGRLYFNSNRRGYGHDIYVATRDAQSGGYTVELLPDPINSVRADSHLAVTKDGSTLFFYSHRSPKAGQVDIWAVMRDDEGAFGAPINIGLPVNAERSINYGAGLSGDETIFYFSRDGLLMQVPYQKVADAIADQSRPPVPQED